MNALLLPHKITWVTAAPLWPAAHADRAVMQRPAILRFTSDRFMDELIAELGARPGELGARSVTGTRPSYREPAPGEGTAITEHLKLYQPAHGHFYVVTSSLVCRLPGLPDHAIDRGHDEQVGFVIRRLVAGGGELALVAAGEARAWQRVTPPDILATGEEILPMFPLGAGEPGKRRRLHAGLVPVARQEELQGAPITSPGAPPPPSPPGDLLEDIEARAVHAIEILKQADRLGEDAERELSRFILLDLADFLHARLPAVWAALAPGQPNPPGAQGALASLLEARRVEAPGGPKLAEALAQAWAHAADIVAGGSGGLPAWNLRSTDATAAELRAALAGALHEVMGADPAPPPPSSAASTFYVLRCVYRRSRCGPLCPDVVSAQSEPFTLAPFFDPDAPTRPIRISVPIDPSVAGLRRFRKNVTIVMSGALRQKLTKAGALKDDKLAASSELDCPGLSFSIPVITICAMVLLFLMIILLNLVFFWLPFVKICRPSLKVG